MSLGTEIRQLHKSIKQYTKNFMTNIENLKFLLYQQSQEK